MSKGVRLLKDAQRADGSWQSRCESGPISLALAALTEAWFGALSPADGRSYAQALRAAQRSDGGFALGPHDGTSSLAATAICRAALRVCGLSDASEWVREAEAAVAALGGYELVAERLQRDGEPTAIYCVMAGLLPADCLPPLSPDMAALPWSERLLDGRFNLSTVVAIFALAAVRERFTHKGLSPSILRGPTRLLARARLSAFIGQFQNENGSWNGSVPCTLQALLALEGVGLTKDDRCVQRALAWLDSRKLCTSAGLEIPLFDGDIAETSLALQALQSCGVSRSDRTVRAAVRYLTERPCTRPQARVNQPKAGAPRVGGWALSAGNQTLPDCDSTGLALGALASSASSQSALERGVQWLRGMQNLSGGFGLTAHGLPDRQPGSLPTLPSLRVDSLTSLVALVSQPPAELGDPAAADVAGRVLWGLADCGLTTADPMVASTVRFLERDLSPAGAWGSARHGSTIAGTSFALLGLAKVGAKLKSLTVRRAIGWLLSQQNADGGFGEQLATTTPRNARTESNAALTGLALRALAELAAKYVGGLNVQRAAQRATDYLLAEQQADGSWHNGEFAFAECGSIHFRWEHYRTILPLLGLGRWSQATSAKP
jgi:squalene cyclase